MAAGCNAAGGACCGTSFNNNSSCCRWGFGTGTQPAATFASANAKWRHLASQCKLVIGPGPNTYPTLPSSLCNPPNLPGWLCLASVAMSAPSSLAKMLVMMRCNSSSFARMTMSGCCAIEETAAGERLLAHQNSPCHWWKAWCAFSHRAPPASAPYHCKNCKCVYHPIIHTTYYILYTIYYIL